MGLGSPADWANDAAVSSNIHPDPRPFRESGWFDVSEGGHVISVRPDAPNGNYLVDWKVKLDEGLPAVLVQAQLYTLRQPITAAIELGAAGWNVRAERLHDLPIDKNPAQLKLLPREMHLFVLERNAE